MKVLTLFLFSLFQFVSCQDPVNKNEGFENHNNEFEAVVPQDTMKESGLLFERISPPGGFRRIELPNGSFGFYLRNLPLKEEGALVQYYNGQSKARRDIYVDVIDLPIGEKDLHQCADAVMRLRAEYLWSNERYEDIHFNLTNGMRVDYKKWMDGFRVDVHGNKTKWVKKKNPANTHETLWSYLEFVFTYAGTASLSKELPSINARDIHIGDVFIQGGFPGHAVIVLDMAVNEEGEKLMLLGQSYMPAQEIQILANPNDSGISPWYTTNFGQELITPEWTFSSKDVKQFTN